MRVFGYTDDKVLEPIELTPAEIVSMEIDPWRIDLFDSNPVTLRRDREPDLHFRRLCDMAFAYTTSNTEAVVGLHDCCGATCLSGTVKPYSTGISITGGRNVEFRSHLMRFLELFSLERGQRDCLVCTPQPADSVTIQGDTVTLTNFSHDLAEIPVNFVGEMFRDLTVPVKLPKRINWVFTVLGAFSPKVFRNAVWQAMDNKVVTSVEVLIEGEEQAAVCSALRGFGIRAKCVRGDGGIRFNHCGCSYEVILLGEGEPVSAYLRADHSHWCSVHALRACAANQVTGPKIAWHDLSLRSTWPVCAQGIKFVLDGRKDESLTFIKVEEAGFPIRPPMGAKPDNSLRQEVQLGHVHRLTGRFPVLVGPCGQLGTLAG